MASVTANGNGRARQLVLPANVRSVDLAARRNGNGRPNAMGHRSKRSPRLQGRSRRAAAQDDVYGEIGTSGLRQYGGFVLEEWLSTLRGRHGAWKYREMMDNSPVAAGIIFAIKMLARQVEWPVEDDIQMRGLEGGFVTSCQNDMSHTWGDLISEVLSMIGYGYAPHELVYKRRQGGDPLPAGSFSEPIDGAYSSSATQEATSEIPASSKYTDGLIGWRRIPIRAQETVFRWIFRGYGGIAGLEQIDWHGGKHLLPIEKMLLFRTETTRNNPESRSLLRSAWTSYFAVQNVQQIELIGIERELAGLPVLTPPEGVDLNDPGQEELMEAAVELVTGIRRDEDEGVVLPSEGWQLELISSGGSRQIDTDQVIRRYEQRMTVSLLADFLLLGQDALGSYAMVDIKSELFGVAVDVILDLICEVFNRYAIPRLLALNGLKPAKLPRITHTSAGRMDLRTVGEFLSNLSIAGCPMPWTEDFIADLFRATRSLSPPDFTPSKQITPPMPNEAAHDSQWRPSWGSENGPAKLPPSGKQHEHVAKAELPEGEGTVLNVGPLLRERQQALSTQLAREMEGALTQLGRQAATGYATVARGAHTPREADRLAGSVMANARVGDFVRSRLRPLLANHAGRVTEDTYRTLRSQVGAEQLSEAAVRRIAASTGRFLKQRDLEPQVRSCVAEAIKDGLGAGESPTQIGERIAANVPRGRFRIAGQGWRAGLIARTETANLQRQASLETYRAVPGLSHVQSDSGELVPIDEAQEAARDMHPDDPTVFLPVLAPERELQPA